MATEKQEIDPVNNDTKPGDGSGSTTTQTEIYIDPEMEKRIVHKFDWLVLPQFVLIIILGYV